MALVSATRFSPYIGELKDGSGLVKLPNLDYTKAESPYSDEHPKTQGNLSLACNSMREGTKLKVTTLSLPALIDLRGTGNVGTLVGEMAENAELHIANSLNLNARLDGKNAGGLVGSMAEGAVIEFEADASVGISAVLNATESAGGIAGSVTTAAGPLDENANVELTSVKANGTQNSGVLYGTCTATGDLKPLTGVSFGSTREVSGPGYCGGLFGTLTLNGNGKCTISGAEDARLTISSTLTSATSATKYGGIAGALSGDVGSNALVVDYCDITSTVSAQDYFQFLGGIVADQQTVTLDARNSTVQVNDPKTRDADNCGFGGIAASVGAGALLLANNMTIGTNSYTTNPRGGGVAGLTGVGSIVYLQGSLNLSGCVLTSNANSGQIVAKQNCSLIYAPGVSITRYSNGLELDDIGNYGELYRISNLLTVDETTYAKTFQTIAGTGNAYTISTPMQYACLALAWQSRGAFATVDGIDKDSWSGLKSSTITLGGNIDLTGCGIGGLTRDVYSKDDTFSGKLDGKGTDGNYTIKLGIGANNQANATSVSNGDGRIYWHNATGLFAALDSSTTVSNLTLAGSIRLSNNKLTSGMYSGALAAQVTGSRTADSMLSGVSTSVVYDTKVNGGNTLYLGGLIGQITGSNAKITFDSDTSLAAEITLSSSGVFTHIGGAVGAISESSNATITCSGATLGGKIEETGSVSNLYAGGLIGTIWPANGTDRQINITGLNVDGFTFSGNATQRMGGILGGIWADTNVMLAGLTTSNTNLTVSGAAALGGLVYRASGKWTVSSVNLGGLTIKAESASALGLLVCHGEPYRELFNHATTYKDIGGLYLKMTAYWGDAYTVPSAENSITFNGSVFDEFVAYTAYRYSDTGYDITHNGSGIISLQTQIEENGTYAVHMDKGSRNTYVNGTKVSKTTNPYSRYYYNLPTVKTACDGDAIDTAEELLIWSVYRYAASNLKQYFSFSGVETLNIGGTAEKPAPFDMVGLSYYPVDIGSETIHLEYANVKFYNADIEAKEAGNKLTREKTQHYTMHYALFHDFKVESTTASSTYTLTVNGVSFAGTVGVVNSGSGALICGKVEGLYNGTHTAVCKVVLADEDLSTKAVKLSGISVSPEGNYTPVLINSFSNHSALEANYIATEQTGKAGSSLFGKVEKSDGESAAVNISIVLEGTIKLNETENKVFSQATLFHSLHFSDGSASYNFTKDKDYDAAENYLHNATYGKELAESVEYAGLQGNYLDGDPITVNNSPADFSSYLPYVAHSPASGGDDYKLENNWHEVAVNVRFNALDNGCGTYGHPYKVDAATLSSMANYINTGRASNGWTLCVPKDLASTPYHKEDNTEHDVVVTYQNGKFRNDTTEYSGEDVRKHLQSAYYQLVYAKDENGIEETTITLNNFSGIGTNTDRAFKGVITGKQADNSVAKITLSGGSSAFIKYSYGSVVRDVEFILNQTPTLNRSEPNRPNNVTEAMRSPDTFFGGVIGCVLGGDNIIENVTVSNFSVTPSGSKSHLVPIGGHVGVIAGGGVIFRGTCTSGYAGDDNYYHNPFIGRVLGGYAFYEGSDTVPDNGNSKVGQNYKINKISPSTSDLNWVSGTDTGTLTVNNAQGLLILSAIVSSGAGSTQSVAYTNGVARNAEYNQIGKPEDDAKDDFELAQSDKAGTASYLLKHFSTCTAREDFCTSGTEGITIKFATEEGGAPKTFDMEDYGNGYRGLSARYVSNAAYKANGADASTVVLRVKSFDGQDATVRNINMDVREYHNDDFHAASMGGIFNIVWTKKQSGGGGVGSNFAQNLTLTNCNVSLKYVDITGDEKNEAETNTFAREDGMRAVSVGGFIGMANDVEATQGLINHNYLFSNIHIRGNSDTSKCEIYGPNSAGGLIGATAMASTSVAGYPGKLLANGKWALFGPSFLNCSYSNINATGGLAAGGMIGDAYASGNTTIPNFNGLGISYSSGSFKSYTSCTVTKEKLIVGQNSTITARAKGSIAGGLFGGAGMRVGVNDTAVNTKSGITIVSDQEIRPLRLQNVNISVSTTNYDPGSVDRPDSGENNAYAAGIIGRIGSVNPSCFYDISIKGGGVTSSATNSRVGGIQGSGYTNSEITMERCEISTYNLSGANTGGFLKS